MAEEAAGNGGDALESSEIRMALTTEPIGKQRWQWVVVFASAEEIVRIDRSKDHFASVAEALAAGQLAINAIRGAAALGAEAASH